MFGLKEEHYVINPKEEFGVFFVRQAEFEKFYQDLLGTVSSGRVPKYVVYGSFGVGKTHFLYHLKNMIGDKYDPIYIQTPPSHRRTSFLEFYGVILSALGRTRVTGLLDQCVKKPDRLSELGLSEDLGLVVTNAIAKEKSFLLWKFLSGVKLKPSEADDLEAVRPELAADDAVALLNALCVLQEEAGGKPFMLLVDEFETTGNIGGDAKLTFTEAIRSLVDESSRIAVIFAVTARAMGEMPSPLYWDPVRRRIGITNYIQFRDYDDAELEKFVHQAIAYRRDPKFDTKKAVAGIKTGETVDTKTYPFSEEAVKEIVSSVVLFKEQNKIEVARPKELLELMDKALRVAINEKKPFISKEMVKSVTEDVVEGLSL